MPAGPRAVTELEHEGLARPVDPRAHRQLSRRKEAVDRALPAPHRPVAVRDDPRRRALKDVQLAHARRDPGGRRDGGGAGDGMARSVRAQPVQRCLRREPRRDAVVHDDDGAVRELQRRAPRAVRRKPPQRLLVFRDRGPLEPLLAHARVRVRVHASVRVHRSGCELGVPGRADLAHDDHVHRRSQPVGDDARDLHPTARHAEHDHVRPVREPPRCELLCQVLARLRAIAPHEPTPPAGTLPCVP